MRVATKIMLSILELWFSGPPPQLKKKTPFYNKAFLNTFKLFLYVSELNIYFCEHFKTLNNLEDLFMEIAKTHHSQYDVQTFSPEGVLVDSSFEFASLEFLVGFQFNDCLS